GTYAADNFGAEAELVVKGGNPDFTREAYLRFDVSGLEAEGPEAFAAAALRLRQEDLGFGGMRYGIATADGEWDEATITWDGRPESAEAFAYWFPEQAGDSLVDVTAQVQAALAAGEPLTLRIWATDYFGAPAQARFGSREAEAAIQPALVLTVPEPEAPPTDGGSTGGADGGLDTTAGSTAGVTSGAGTEAGGSDA